ncbi:MAG: hypothetical protein U0Y10_10235 [Spirosomataceae bacterium]
MKKLVFTINQGQLWGVTVDHATPGRADVLVSVQVLEAVAKTRVDAGLCGKPAAHMKSVEVRPVC